MATLHQSVYLSENLEAREKHQLGLNAAENHDFVAAHTNFTAALSHLPAIANSTTDSRTQRARITRDNAFTHGLESIAENKHEHLETATLVMHEALGHTAGFVSSVTPMTFQNAGPHETPKRPRREVFAEHGATIGLLGRLSTIDTVVFGNQVDLAETTTYYGHAHDMLRLGGNGYYRTNNAMHGARQERINGRIVHAGVWLARAAFGVVWTAAKDTKNTKHAIATFVQRTIDLKSITSARQSVSKRP